MTLATSAPSRVTSYPATPKPSVERSQESRIRVGEAAVATTREGTVGGVTSGVRAHAGAEGGERLPAASSARMAKQVSAEVRGASSR